VAENAQEWIWEIDNDGLYTYSSPVVERILGYSPEEIIGKKHFYDFFHPQDKDALKEAALQAFAKKEPFSRFVNKNVHKNGNEVIFETSGVPILNSKGELLGYRGVDIDITERRKMEDELKQERDTLEMVTQNIGAGVAIISKDYCTVWANGVLKQIFGDVEGKICYSTYNKRSAICPKCGVREIFEEGKGQVVHEQVGEDAKGNTIWSQIIATPIRDKEEKIIGALELVVPITERKQMMKKLEGYSQQLEEMVEKRTRQLKEAQEQLVKSERLAAIGQVAAMVGHDLRNPLTGIKGAAYYLKTKPALKTDKKTMEMLELIEKDIEYSNKIITDLLEYSREVHLELTETTPRSIVSETLSLLEVPKNVEIINLTQDEPRTKVDIEKLNRFFVNLIKNAFDAMPKGGKLTIKSIRTHDNVELAFTDTGMGMTKEQMGKIWTPFFTTKAKGMGLGLPICKRIVEAHGGHISVQSMAGLGTTFTVTIPIEPKITDGGEKYG
jgi:PAS domain S-box-containing protein